MVEQLDSSQPSETELEAALATRMVTALRVGHIWHDRGAEAGSPWPDAQGEVRRCARIREHPEDLLAGDRFGSPSNRIDSCPQLIGRPQISHDASAGLTTVPSIDVSLREAHP